MLDPSAWIGRETQLDVQYLVATCRNHKCFFKQLFRPNQPEGPRNARAGEEAANTIRVNKISGKESNVRGIMDLMANRIATLHTLDTLELGKWTSLGSEKPLTVRDVSCCENPDAVYRK